VKVGNDPDNAELIRFSVSDTGRGIAPEHLERIFDKLYQVRETDTAIVGGVGLGLFIASGIVRLHGGRMWVESTVGRGSTFHFTVPKCTRSPCRHILYVDDDIAAQKLVSSLLERAGFEVSVAGDGKTALEMAQRQAVDLAMVDLCLPGMSGPVLLRELRRQWCDMPILLYTGHTDSHLMAHAMVDVTPLTLLTKTCSPEKLIATVRALLEKTPTPEAKAALATKHEGLTNDEPRMMKGQNKDEENTDC
jgi:CheY-like chemotaxis protein